MDNILLVGAFFSGLTMALILGRIFLRWMTPFVQSQISDRQPSSHKHKKATPTMGGVVILLSCLVSVLFFGGLSYSVCLVLGSGIAFGLLGMWDDWCKITKKNGIFAKTKFIAQFGCAGVLASAWYMWLPDARLVIPGWGTLFLGVLLVPWAVWVMLATTNAVNLTDGLDGLAATTMCIALGAYAVVLGVTGALSWELGIMITALLGSLIGFLWYNLYPAKMFMGDTGSLALGGMLAMLALVSRYELLLPLIGCIFVIETLSVIVQVGGYRLYGKRFFRMAPLHHHFELQGWSEIKVVSGFALFALCVASTTLICLYVI